MLATVVNLSLPLKKKEVCLKARSRGAQPKSWLLWNLRQEDQKFKISLSYRMNSRAGWL